MAAGASARAGSAAGGSAACEQRGQRALGELAAARRRQLLVVDELERGAACRGRQVEQRGQAQDQPVMAVVAFRAGRFDGAQHVAHGIDQGEQGVGDVLVEQQLAVAQPAEQALAGMGDGLQAFEAEEAAGALDGVDGAEDAAEMLAVLRVLLEGDEFAIEPIQALIALDQEFLDQIIDARHDGTPHAWSLAHALRDHATPGGNTRIGGKSRSPGC